MSEVTSPLQLRITLSGVTTNREVDSVTPLSLTFAGGFVLNGLGTGTALSPLNLGALGRLDRRILEQGFNSIEFQLRFQRTIEAIEAALEAQNAQIEYQAGILAAIQAASAQAQVASDMTMQLSQRVSVEGSYPDPTQVLTSSADGTITIASHTRRYTDGTSVAVDAGSISGLLNETRYRVFYADAGRAGGAVAYQATTNVVAQGGDIHLVGETTVPAIGNPPVGGTGPTAPGVPPREPGDPPEGYEVF